MQGLKLFVRKIVFCRHTSYDFNRLVLKSGWLIHKNALFTRTQVVLLPMRSKMIRRSHESLSTFRTSQLLQKIGSQNQFITDQHWWAYNTDHMDSRTRVRDPGNCGRVVVIIFRKTDTVCTQSTGRWPFISRKTGTGRTWTQQLWRRDWTMYTHESGNLWMRCHRIFKTCMYTLQNGCDNYFKETRHSTDIDTTGMGAYLGDVHHTHLPREYKHYISSCHKYQDDVTGRTQTRLFQEILQGCIQWGVVKGVSTCAVPMHAPQTGSFWQGVGEVSTA